MTQARCFQCGKELLKVGKPMEELIKNKFPLFCSGFCVNKFPNNGTKEFEERMKKFMKEYHIK